MKSDISVCTGVPDLLGGSSGGCTVEERLSAKGRCQRVQSMNLKVKCPESYPERYLGNNMCVAWKIRMT